MVDPSCQGCRERDARVAELEARLAELRRESAYLRDEAKTERDLRPLTRGSVSPFLDWQPVAPWRDPIERGATLVFLGLGGERPHFAIDAR